MLRRIRGIALMRGAGRGSMLAGMDTNGMNYMTPGGREAYRESSAWAVIGITLAVLLTVGALVLIGGTVLLFVGLSHYGAT